MPSSRRSPDAAPGGLARSILAHPAVQRLARRLPLVGPPLIRAELIGRYIAHHGRPPRLDPPVNFNERMLHRILHDRAPWLRQLNDKLAVRQVIRDRAGPAALVPLLGVWRDPAAIDWHSLPLPFVLKPNHASGPIAIVRSAADLDPQRLAAIARGWLRTDFFDVALEWGYRGLPRRLLAEPLLRGADGGTVTEAQIFTFWGEVALIRIVAGRKGSAERRDNWFDAAGTPQVLRLRARTGEYVLPPEELQRLTRLGQKVGAGFGQLRIDLYLTDAGPLIGELTTYAQAAGMKWDPPAWNDRLGQIWAEAEMRHAPH